MVKDKLQWKTGGGSAYTHLKKNRFFYSSLEKEVIGGGVCSTPQQRTLSAVRCLREFFSPFQVTHSISVGSKAWAFLQLFQNSSFLV